MIKSYFKTAFRNLWKSKGYNFLNIFGLSVGIACAGFIFLWIEDETGYDHHHPRKDQVYQVMGNQSYDGRTFTYAATPGLMSPAMKAELPEVKNSARMTWNQNLLFSLGEKPLYEKGSYADSSIFDILGITFIQGSKDKAFEQLHSVVISEKMAERFFGNSKDIIGRQLKFNNKDEYSITGVMKDLPENTTYKPDWVIPYEVYHAKNSWLDHWGSNGIMTFVELDSKADPAALDKKIHLFVHNKDSLAAVRPFLFSMNDWRLRNKFEEGVHAGGRIQYVNMFNIIAWVILLIACINFMNLATARSEKRAREVGVRKVLGAGRGTLVGQFMGESILLSFFSVVLAIVLMLSLMSLFNGVVDKSLSMGLNKPTHMAMLIFIGLICGVVAGSYPALYMSSFKPIWVFKGIKMKGSTPAVIRKVLVVAQFFFSIVLIISTIIIYQQLQHVKNRDLGYSTDNLVQIDLRGNMDMNFPVIKQDLLSTGYIDNAALSGLNILQGGTSTTDFSWEGKDPSKDVLITTNYVSPEYISTAAMRIRQGRDFNPVRGHDSLGVIINKALADIISPDPVGKLMLRDTSETGGISFTIVGVTDDFIFGDMYKKSEPTIMLAAPNLPDYVDYMYIRIKAGSNMEKAVTAIGSVIKKANPEYPFDYSFVDQDFDKKFKSEALVGRLSRIFAILAIIISCLGLFGLSAFTAESRTKEIGVRKVLGASVAGITALLSKGFLQLIGIAAIIAFPVAWLLMHNWLQDYAYRINISWTVFALAGGLSLLIALVTISFQSIRAALSNPIKSLRTE
jgi:predicted permease